MLCSLGCNLNKANTWKNESIDTSLKSEIDILTSTIVTALLENNSEKIISMSGKAMFDNATEKELTEFVEAVSKMLKKDKFQILDEYYVLNSTDKGSNTLIGDEYTISYTALNNEIYTSLLEIKTESHLTLILELIYGKYGKEWKLNTCQIGHYKYLENTMLDFYQKSQTQYEKGYLINAVNNIQLTQQLIKPFKTTFSYRKESEINSFTNKLIQEIKEIYSFPDEVSSIKTKPIILALSPKILIDGIYPLVDYKSNINLSDTIALKKEYLELSKVVFEKYKGIKEENEIVIFKAFDEIPDGKTLIDTYTFIYRKK
jgi:hypothetical protein